MSLQLHEYITCKFSSVIYRISSTELKKLDHVCLLGYYKTCSSTEKHPSLHNPALHKPSLFDSTHFYEQLLSRMRHSKRKIRSKISEDNFENSQRISSTPSNLTLMCEFQRSNVKYPASFSFVLPFFHAKIKKKVMLFKYMKYTIFYMQPQILLHSMRPRQARSLDTHLLFNLISSSDYAHFFCGSLGTAAFHALYLSYFLTFTSIHFFSVLEKVPLTSHPGVTCF